MLGIRIPTWLEGHAGSAECTLQWCCDWFHCHRSNGPALPAPLRDLGGVAVLGTQRASALLLRHALSSWSWWAAPALGMANNAHAPSRSQRPHRHQRWCFLFLFGHRSSSALTATLCVEFFFFFSLTRSLARLFCVHQNENFPDSDNRCIMHYF